MYKNYKEIANELGISASVINKYRQIGLLDDLIEVKQKGKVKHLEISDDVPQRIKNIKKLQKDGYELKAIIHKLIPISIYDISISNGSGIHRIEKRIHFTLVTSDNVETVYFKNEPQKISEKEMKEVRDMLIKEGKYDLAEKIKFTPKEFTFLFDKFEKTVFDPDFVKKQKLLRSIQENVKPFQWIEQAEGRIIFCELYGSQQQYDNYNQCLKFTPAIRFSNINKYAIRYNIGIRFLNEIPFSAEYAYLKERLVKMYKKKMKELNISDTDDAFTSYSLANVVSDKESELLNIIRKGEYKTIEVIKKNGNKIVVKATKSQYSANIKELLDIYKKREYNKISVTQKDGKTFFITKEDHYKI